MLAGALGATAASGFVNGIIPPLLPDLRGAFGLSEVGVAWIVSSFSVARLAVDLPAGCVVDRVGRRRVFVAGSVLLGGGALLFAAAPAPWALYLGRAACGVGYGVTALVLLLLVVASGPPELRSRTGSLLEATTVLGFLTSGLAAGPLANLLGWRGALATAGLLALVAMALAARLAGRAWGDAQRREEREVRDPAPERRSGSGAPTSPVPALAAAFAIAFIWAGVVVTLMPIVAAERHGLDATGIGRILSLSYVADLLLILPVAAMADRTGGRGFVIGGLLVAAVATPGVLLAGGPALLGIAVFLQGTTFASWMIPPALLLQGVARARQAPMLGVYRFTSDVAFVAGPLVLAAVYARGGPAWAALAGSAVALAAAGAMLRGRPRGRCR